MSVRVLCLHGMGVDGNVFRAMTASFRSSLPSDCDFTFLDGPSICGPAPGAAAFYDGPYRCWYNTPSRERVAKAHSYVKEAALDKGKFDVVVGFSQGAALAASILLHHTLEHPDEPPLFKAAFFISAPLPFSRDLEHGIDVRSYFDIDASKPLPTNRPTVPPDFLIPQRGASNGAAGAGAKVADVTFGFETADKHVTADEGGPFYNIFHPTVDEVRISIPTGHVYGKKDPWRKHSLELMDFCRRSSMVRLEHDGGHEIPRDAGDDIAELFDELLTMAGLD